MENIKIILAMLIFPLLGTAGALAQTGKIAMDVSWDGTRCNHSHGLCTTSQSSNKNISESKFYAEKVNETTFRLVVNRKNIGKDEELKITGKEFSAAKASENKELVIEEDFILDRQTTEAIGLKTDFIIIPKGKYPIVFDDEKIIITLNVTK